MKRQQGKCDNKKMSSESEDSSDEELVETTSKRKKPNTKQIKLTRKSKNFITKLPVEATGCLPNTLLYGCSKRTNKALVKVTGMVRPYKNVHLQIKEMGEWAEFVRRCQLLPGFRDDSLLATNFDAMERWLTNNAKDGSLAPLGSDHVDDRIVIDRPGEVPSQFLLMGDTICDPQGFTWTQVQNFIPRPVKTKPHKSHTLVLHRSGYQIATNIDNPLTKFKKYPILLDLEQRCEVTGGPVAGKHFVMVASNCGVFYESSLELKKAYAPNQTLGDLGKLIARMENGELKSFMQKLIRFAPQHVEMGAVLFKTETVLQAVCECSLVHPGGKSPNTGLYIRGLPSFLKRLGVTIVEDAWIEDGANILHDLFLMSIIATNDPTYFPTKTQLSRIFDAAQRALISVHGMVYDNQNAGDAIVLKPKLCHAERASCFLDILKSFPWDLTMVRYVCKHDKTPKFETTKNTPRPFAMDISHYEDHHVSGEFAYFLNPRALLLARERYVPSEIFGDLNDQKSRPYAVLFRQVFQASSGFNYRRTPDKLSYMLKEDELAGMIRKAQSIYFLAKHAPFVEICSAAEEEVKLAPQLDAMVDVEFELDSMWLAAAVGHLDVRVDRTNYFVFITQIEPQIKLDVVRCPARQQKEIEIDEDARQAAIALGFAMLRGGDVKLQNTQSIIGIDKNVILVDDDKQLCFVGSDGVVSIPNLIISAQTSCNFVKIKALFDSVPVGALQRLWQLSLGFCTFVEFPKIARNGGPEDKPLNTFDIDVFQLCLKLLPVLRLYKQRFFEVQERVTFWYIRSEILKPCIAFKLDNVLISSSPASSSSSSSSSSTQGWSMHTDSQKRTPTSQQDIALRILERRCTEANFVIMPPGSGKTFIFGQYLLILKRKKQLPQYVLFVTPQSAVEGVARELRCFTKAVFVRNMKKSKKTLEDLQPGITIISHDHLRLAGDMFSKTLPKTHMVLDEFHMCLCTKTQRTKMALEYAAAAANLTAMSGTPTINSDLMDLLPLLSTIVPFELTINNFFVGYSFAINQKEGVDIKVIDKEINIPVPAECASFWNLLPASLGGCNNKRLEGRDLNMLIQYSQDVADIKMIERTLHYVNKLKHVVFVVAHKADHVTKLRDMLLNADIASNDIYCVFKRSDAITLTENAIASTVPNKDPRIRRYSVIICPIHISCGFSMQIANVQVSSVYPSNAAVRSQIRGRIKRLGSTFKEVTYVTVICGRIQELIYFRYDRDDSLASILMDLALPDAARLSSTQRKLLCS